METETLLAPEKKRISKIFGVSAYALPAIILPTGALCVEFVMKICSQVFFDPIPTYGHAALVALVPATHLLALRVLEGRSKRRTLAEFCIGAAFAVSLIYTILFLPILPFAAMYTAFSIGALFLPALLTILPFAPLATLICEVYAFLKLRRQSSLPAKKFKLIPIFGFVCGLSSLALVESPRFFTTYAVARLQQDPEDIAALKLLRNFGDSQMILQASYSDTNALKDFHSWLLNLADAKRPFDFFERGSQISLSTQDARFLYYRVTGANFNSVPAPSRSSDGLFSRFGNDIGGKGVGEKSDDVSLVSSSLDGALSAETMSGYIEWIMVFKNDSPFLQEEARTEIALPRGAVVSRVTLWINDEEVEALLGSRGEARAAYERVVFRKRDPLLVTTTGPDRILVQCFPIPPKGGEMKIRLGITTSLIPTEHGKASLRFPSFAEHNFRIPDSSKHLVWFESHQAFQANRGDVMAIAEQDGLFKAEGSIAATQDLSQVSLEMTGITSDRELTSADNDQLIHQQLIEKAYPASENIVLVVDGSKKTKEYLSDLLPVFRSSLRTKRVLALFAGDTVEPLSDGYVEMNEREIDLLLAKLRTKSFHGGMDGIPALREALAKSASLSSSSILWVHAGKPFRSPLMPTLEQYTRRAGARGQIVSLPLGVDSDRLDEQLQDLGLLRSIPLSIQELPLARKLSVLVHGGKYLTLERTSEPRMESHLGISEYPHVNRLWGAARVGELLQTSTLSPKDTQSYREEALKVAMRYRIVTPVSGAVVLEKTDAAAASNLEPAEPGKVPAIPEPEMICLFMTLLLLLGIQSARKKYTVRATVL